MTVDRCDPSPLTKQARRITRRLGAHGLAVTSATVGTEVRVSLDSDPSIFVHCQVDTPVSVVEMGIRGWMARGEVPKP